MYIFRSGIDIMGGISSSQQTTSTCIQLKGRKLVDLGFLNDNTLVLLCNETGNIARNLNSRPVTFSSDIDIIDNTPIITTVPIESDRLQYAPYNSVAENIPIVELSDLQEFALPPEYTTRTVRMEVHDETDFRGHVPMRICLLSSNRTTWRAFTVPECA